ncbi:MAG: hypothetical protein LBJ47_11980, partial [Tannerella sp.]|nr:hypothetical protein [Tannerella sp.]
PVTSEEERRSNPGAGDDPETVTCPAKPVPVTSEEERRSNPCAGDYPETVACPAKLTDES